MRRATVLAVSTVVVVLLGVVFLYEFGPLGDSDFVLPEVNRYEGDIVFLPAAQDYSGSHPDSGGRWIDWERDVWMFAFTSDLDVHRKALEEAGLDMDSGKHELVLVKYTNVELDAVRDRLHEDWAVPAVEWDLIRARVDTSTNGVEVGVPWTDQDRVQPLIDSRGDRHSFPAWSVVTGAPPLESDDAFRSSRNSVA